MFEKLLVIALAIFVLALAIEPPFTAYHSPSPVAAVEKISAAAGVKKPAEKCTYTMVETDSHTLTVYAVCDYT